MDFWTYQQKALKTATYRKNAMGPIYPTLGLVGEAGEVAEKIKKVLRDNNGVFSEERVDEIAGELGDVLWYIAMLAYELDLNLNEIALANLSKLISRQQRDKLHGSGDKR